MKLPIKTIRLDFQQAELLFAEKVSEIAKAVLRGDPIPPVTVRFDGENYWLQDGFHRVAAVLSINREEIDAEVKPGNLADIEADFKEMVRSMKGKW